MIATAITLVAAFFVRFVFHSLVVYAPRKAGARASRARQFVEELDAQAMSPGRALASTPDGAPGQPIRPTSESSPMP